jgi:homeobox protein HEX
MTIWCAQIAGWDPRLPWLYPYLQKTQQKRKGGQIRFTNEQTDSLEQKFDSHKYLSPQERKKLAKSLGLSERQVSLMDRKYRRCKGSNTQQSRDTAGGGSIHSTMFGYCSDSF